MKSLAFAFKANILQIMGIFLAFILPIRGLLLAIGLCIALDTVFGVAKALKLKQDITSRGLSKIISKMFLYEGVVLLFFVLDIFVLGEFIAVFIGIKYFLTKIISCVLVFIELKSMDENFKLIYRVSLWDKFKDMLARAKELKQEINEIKEPDPKP